VLHAELRRVHTDHHQAVLPVRVGPGAEVRQGAEPVDAGVRPEVDGDDRAVEVGRGEWVGVQPLVGTVERRHPTLEWELQP
jgi:hypothetical protein